MTVFIQRDRESTWQFMVFEKDGGEAILNYIEMCVSPIFVYPRKSMDHFVKYICYELHVNVIPEITKVLDLLNTDIELVVSDDVQLSSFIDSCERQLTNGRVFNEKTNA